MIKRWTYVLALSAAIALLFSSCGETWSGLAIATKLPLTLAPGQGVHHATLPTEVIARSGLLEMLFDEASQSVLIRGFNQTSMPAVWSTLPLQAEEHPDATVFTANVVANGHSIALNSQDHAAAFVPPTKTILYNKQGKAVGLEVKYTLSTNAATAQKEQWSKTDVAFLVRVSYKLESGNLVLTCTWQNSSNNPNAFIESLQLLEYFGALRNPEPNDFLLVPDGTGALLYPARKSDNAPSLESATLEFSVYDYDGAIGRSDATNSETMRYYSEEPNDPDPMLQAKLAVWGAKAGDAAFIGVVEQGASFASILVQQNRSDASGAELSTIGARFCVTSTTGARAGTPYLRAPQSFAQETNGTSSSHLRIGYRFFSGEGANASTMAVAVREQMISNGWLSSTKTINNDEPLLPLQITLHGTEGKNTNGTRTLTTYQQTQDILTRLKNKGINAINVRLRNSLSGAWKQQPAGGLSPLLRLGGKAQLRKLQAFCALQGFTLFPEAQLFRPGKTEFFSLHGTKMNTLRASTDLSASIGSLLKSLSRYQTGGLALQDAGSTLYSDFAHDFSREDLAAWLLQKLPALSAQWKLMLSDGNIYALRSADIVTDLPLTTQLRMPGSRTKPRYQAVPLLPIVLHGMVEYTGVPLNFEQNPEEAFLRSISFGAALAWEWSARSAQTEALYFEPWIETATSYSLRANEALANLRGAHITSYDRIEDTGVTRTTFSNNAQLYVNFDAIDRTINGIFIPARDFVRIGGSTEA